MVEFFAGVTIASLILCILNLIRIHMFSKHMGREIDRVFNARITGNLEVFWPNVNACWANFKWYDVFNYKFNALMVYDDSH